MCLLWLSWLVEFWELWEKKITCLTRSWFIYTVFRNNYTVRWGVTDRGSYEWLIGTGRWKLVWWGGLTRGGQSPLRTPSGGQSPCSPHYGARPIRSAGTPGHPVDYRKTRRLILSKTFHLDWRKRLCKGGRGGGAYLQPTNLGAYFWIWLLKSEGLMASWFTDVHRLWVSFANSETAGKGRRNNEGKLDHNDVKSCLMCICNHKVDRMDLHRNFDHFTFFILPELKM